MRSLAASLLVLSVTDLASISPSFAQERFHLARSGRPALLSVYFNCTNRHGLTGMSPTGTAYNGTIITRLSAGNRCGNPYQPLIQVFYMSTPGFTGRDDAFIYHRGPPRRLTIHVR